MASFEHPMAIARRAEPRRQVQMLARVRHGLDSMTVVLRDLSHGGARIEGLAGLSRDEVLMIALPGRKPMMAFVAWSGDLAAGLEFAETLGDEIFDDLVASYSLGHVASPCAMPAMLAA